jgi:toxin ParE1/3/4
MKRRKTPDYRLSELAESDIAGILDFTTDMWGGSQADRYLDQLVRCFEGIAKMPSLGRACDELITGFRRIEVGRHVVFYRANDEGAFIARVLHDRMLVTSEVLAGQQM